MKFQVLAISTEHFEKHDPHDLAHDPLAYATHIPYLYSVLFASWIPDSALVPIDFGSDRDSKSR